MTHRAAGKLVAVPVICSTIALLAGAAPASAAQHRGPTLAMSVRMSPLPASAPPASALPATGRTPMAAECLPAPNKLNRTRSCQKSHFTWTFFRNGLPVGSVGAELTQFIQLNPRGKDWTEHDSWAGVTASGMVAAISMDITASCDSPCHATDHFIGVLADGLDGIVHYTDDVAKDHQHETPVQYHMVFDSPPFIPQNTIDWTSDAKLRCDNGLAKADSTGCVFPAFKPTLHLPISRFGAAAEMVRFAQEDMSEHWGLKGEGKELTRQADETIVKANRAKVCDSTFTNLGTAIGHPDDKDSCDEFPFAATNQSGAATLGASTGAACAQVQALRIKDTGTEAEQWSGLRITHPRLGAPCVRGHIPGKLNSATGGAYGAFVQNQRVINGDGFWVSVS
jgi:hypothetical protein